MDEQKSKIINFLNNFDEIKTPACVGTNTLGLFAENKLPDKEMAEVEAHIQSCLYCLDKLTEMKELLYLATEVEPINPELDRKLTNLFSSH